MKYSVSTEGAALIDQKMNCIMVLLLSSLAVQTCVSLWGVRGAIRK